MRGGFWWWTAQGVATPLQGGREGLLKNLNGVRGLLPGREIDVVPLPREREFFTDTLLVRVHLIIAMILVDRPCAMGVLNSLSHAALHLPF